MRVGDGIRYRRPRGDYPFILVGYDEVGQTYTVEYLHTGRRYPCPARSIFPWEGQTLDELDPTREFEVGDTVIFLWKGEVYLSGDSNEPYICEVLEVNGDYLVCYFNQGVGRQSYRKASFRHYDLKPKKKRKSLTSFIQQVEKEYA